MGAVKICSADKMFSLCIREAADWCCDRCGTYYPEGKRMGLHCSHHHGRGKWGTRFVVENAAAHCYGCHRHLGSQPAEHDRWTREYIGEGAYEILLEKVRDTSLGREARRSKKEIAAHYRAEHKRILELRKEGHTGRLELVSWR